MFRLSMLMLCLVFAAAAAGRYKAEDAVGEQRRQLRALAVEKQAELQEIQLLKAEIAYLESPERLRRVSGRAMELAPLSGDQLLTATDFVEAFGAGAGDGTRIADAEATPTLDLDAIRHAIAVADLGEVQ